jgi:hypothetical protein
MNREQLEKNIGAEYDDAFNHNAAALPVGEVIAPNGMRVMSRAEWVAENVKDELRRS